MPEEGVFPVRSCRALSLLSLESKGSGKWLAGGMLWITADRDSVRSVRGSLRKPSETVYNRSNLEGYSDDIGSGALSEFRGKRGSRIGRRCLSTHHGEVRTFVPARKNSG